MKRYKTPTQVEADYEWAKALESTQRHKAGAACPAWADVEAMRAVYVEARELSRTLENSYHVDHIVPLCGNHVSGLHVPSNLRAIPASVNLQKSNKHTTK